MSNESEKKCLECPSLMPERVCIKTTKEFINLVIEASFGPNLEEFIQSIPSSFFESEMGRLLLESIEIEPSDDIRRIVEKIRISNGRTIEDCDDHIAMHEEAINNHVEGCKGPIKMRATKDTRTITVTVCNSPNNLDGQTTDEPVSIQRDRAF